MPEAKYIAILAKDRTHIACIEENKKNRRAFCGYEGPVGISKGKACICGGCYDFIQRWLCERK